MIFEHLDKRKHVYEYRQDDIPSQNTIEDLLRKTWKVTPSKQNVMPYKISVLGPDANITKQKVYNKVVSNDKRMSVEGLKEGAVTQTSTEINPHYRHILHNPYLIVFSQRVCSDKDINPFYKSKIKTGQFMEQASEKWLGDIRSSTSFEAGLFAQNLASLCLEQDIHCSFTGCFSGNVKKWSDIDFVDYDVLMLMSLGKAKTFRREFMSQETSDQDYKTAFENVVKFEQ
jgi:hypothetical protein|tara:strand:+ start:1106 stop:1792 length:687 start_codon:yes stop_codon:yes gene_type:complete